MDSDRCVEAAIAEGSFPVAQSVVVMHQLYEFCCLYGKIEFVVSSVTRSNAPIEKSNSEPGVGLGLKATDMLALHSNTSGVDVETEFWHWSFAMTLMM